MKLENLGCLKCGGVLERSRDNVYHCKACGRSFSQNAMEKAAEEILREVLLQRISARNVQKTARNEEFYPTLDDYDTEKFKIENGVLAEYKKYLSNDEVVIPKGVTVIGVNAFNWSRMSNVIIPDGVISIEYGAFSNCLNLARVELPPSVLTINEKAFDECLELQEVFISCGVTEVKNDAFVNCPNLSSIVVDKRNARYSGVGNCLIEKSSQTLILGCSDSVIPSDGSVTSIGDGAFAFSNIESVVIPDSVTSIGNQAFYMCEKLTNVTLGRNLTTIKKEAFYHCGSLADLTVKSARLGLVDYGVFLGCQNLVRIALPVGITTLSRNLFNSSGLSEIIIPHGVTTIEEGVFFQCENLTNVQIPASVRTIGRDVFNGCGNLRQISFDGTIAQWNSIKISGDWHYRVPAKYVACRNGYVPI